MEPITDPWTWMKLYLVIGTFVGIVLFLIVTWYISECYEPGQKQTPGRRPRRNWQLPKREQIYDGEVVDEYPPLYDRNPQTDHLLPEPNTSFTPEDDAAWERLRQNGYVE